MEVHFEIIVFGENTLHFYENKNIIYSLLSPPMLNIGFKISGV